MTAKFTPELDHFLEEVTKLPRLPKVIHYEDDYNDVVRSIVVDEGDEAVVLFKDGEKVTLYFNAIQPRVRTLIRYCTLRWIQSLAPASAVYYFQSIRAVDAGDIESLATALPLQARSNWQALLPRYGIAELTALKAFLALLCEVRFGGWSPMFADFVVKAFPNHSRDMYATVRSGDAFLETHEEARLVRWFDDVVQRTDTLIRPDLEVACALVCAYQFGMRPKQLGIIRKGDCTVRHSPDDGSAIVHLGFRMIKQRDPALSRLPLSRRVKREWAPLFSKLMELKKDDASDSFLFGFRSRAVSVRPTHLAPEAWM